MTKDDLSCHFKCYHDTIIDKKYFAFSYGDEQEKATLLICSEGKIAPGRPPRARLLYPIHFTQMAQSPINIG